MSLSDLELMMEADWYFRKIVRKFVKERDRITIEGMTLPGMFILHKIIEDGEQRLSDLAEELDFTSGAITAVTDKLERRGLAMRQRLPADRRTVLLMVTDEGRAFYERHRNIGVACTTLLFGDVGREELEQQITLYRNMAERLEGFSQAILEMATVNEQKHGATTDNKRPPARTPSVQANQKQATQTKPRFLSY